MIDVDKMEEEPILQNNKRERDVGCSPEKPKKKKKGKLELSPEEVQRLETIVLGDASSFVSNLGPLGKVKDNQIEEERKAAWCDEDDESITVGDALSHCRHDPLVLDKKKGYKVTMEGRFKELVGTPSWAVLGRAKGKSRAADSSDEEDDAAILQRCGSTVERGGRGSLGKLVIEARRLASLNSATRTEGPIVTSVQFHPTSEVALVAGESGVASLFQVDGKGNGKLASVHFQDFPIRCARFNGDGTQAILGSNLHDHFYVYDLMEGRSLKFRLDNRNNMKRFEVSRDGKWVAACGRSGDIILMSGKSKEAVGTLRMNGVCTSLAFSPDSSLLYAHGDGDEFWCFDVGRRMCCGHWVDEGCVGGGSVVAVGASLVATGSPSGVVNVYRASDLTPSAPAPPKPLKSVMNLVTPVTALQFDPTEQILASASYHKEGAVKMLHIDSLTTFSNFPSEVGASSLRRVQALAFSPSSGYLALTNNKSTAFLYRLKHFGNY